MARGTGPDERRLTLLLDENRPHSLSLLLQADPMFDTCHVYDDHVGLRFEKDPEVMAYAMRHRRALLTADRRIVGQLQAGKVAPAPLILVPLCEHPEDTYLKLRQAQPLWARELIPGTVLDLREDLAALRTVLWRPDGRNGKSVPQPLHQPVVTSPRQYLESRLSAYMRGCVAAPPAALRRHPVVASATRVA